MNITINNYEEYFLLYLDGELNAADRAAVETFLKENPAFEPAFQELQEVYLLPEPVLHMPGKESLLKQTGQVNWEEQLLLATDGELDDAGMAALHLQMEAEPVLATQLALLKQTILPIEHVAHPHKTELLRYEKGRVRRMAPWLRYMAAAAVATGIVLALLPRTQKSPDAADAVVRNGNGSVNGRPAKGSTALPAAKNREAGVQAAANAADAVQKTGMAKTLDKQNQPQVQPNNGAPPSYIKTTDAKAAELLMAQRVQQKMPQPMVEPMPTTAAQATARNGSNTPVSTLPGTQPETPVTNEVLVAMAPAKNTEKIIAPGSNLTLGKTYQYLEDQEEDQRLYVASVSINKNKVKGLLRRAGRLFGGARAVAAIPVDEQATAPAQIRTSK